MQIIIPMSGFGERFRRAGYAVPKPLIRVDGKPIIAHVIDMFPGAGDFVFVCNKDHLREPAYRMREILSEYCPTGRIIGIDPHKLGPVHAVLSILSMLDLEMPTIVNYCDFTCYWNFDHFKKWVRQIECDGCIPAYRGFHPHSLGTTNYAYMRERNGWMVDIREKAPFTDDRMNEYASSGTYYFKTGRLVAEYFQKTVASDLSVNGEYYVSLAYKPMLDDGKSVAIYDLQHFMQWGTPEDLLEYEYWSRAFTGLIANKRPPALPGSTMIMPMVGEGRRFAIEGYTRPKPLVEVSGKPMAVQAANDLPNAPRNIFVMRQDLSQRRELEATITRYFPRSDIVTLEKITEGQACTCLEALNRVQAEPGWLTIAACDNGIVYNYETLQRLIADQDVDILIWVARGYPGARQNPKAYGWVDADDLGIVRRVSVKEPLSDPRTDPIIIGAFSFRTPEHFTRAAKRMIARGARVNGEYYVDTCINDAIELGLRCKLMQVESYLCWGTPNDLKTFEYWQSCFDKWPGHRYRLEDDLHIDKEAIGPLRKRYAATHPTLPGPRP